MSCPRYSFENQRIYKRYHIDDDSATIELFQYPNGSRVVMVTSITKYDQICESLKYFKHDGFISTDEENKSITFKNDHLVGEFNRYQAMMWNFLIIMKIFLSIEETIFILIANDFSIDEYSLDEQCGIFLDSFQTDEEELAKFQYNISLQKNTNWNPIY